MENPSDDAHLTILPHLDVHYLRYGCVCMGALINGGYRVYVVDALLEP